MSYIRGGNFGDNIFTSSHTTMCITGPTALPTWLQVTALWDQQNVINHSLVKAKWMAQ